MFVHILRATAYLILVCGGIRSWGAAAAGPPEAVLRLPSHGASATVIWTEKDRTFILGCGHAYQGKDRQVGMALDVTKKVPKLLAVDYELDLSLVELAEGPLPDKCQIPAEPFKPGRNLLSVGYDGMKTPATHKQATIVQVGPSITYTKEKPWHGRSGGALIDIDAGVLVGVCSGYEVHPGGRGIYVSLPAVQRFLKKQGWSIRTETANPFIRQPFC